MTELEQALLEAGQTGRLALLFEAVRGEKTKFSMDIRGTRESEDVWSIRVTLHDGSSWTRKAFEQELMTLMNDFHAFFAKMGRERGRA